MGGQGCGGVRVGHTAQISTFQGGDREVTQQLLALLRQRGGEEQHRVAAGDGKLLGLDGEDGGGDTGIGTGGHRRSVLLALVEGGIAQSHHQGQTGGQSAAGLPSSGEAEDWGSLPGQALQNLLVQLRRHIRGQAVQVSAELGQLPV